MKFYIRSDNFIGFFQTPGEIRVGDTVYADSQKFADKEMTKAIGPSYAHYSVVGSEPVSSSGNGNAFRVKAMSTRVLDFLGDGVVTAAGVSEQIWTLSPVTRQIVDSQVLSNRLTITGGSGKFMDVCGTYDVKTLPDGTHLGEIDKYCREKRLAFIDFIGYLTVGVGLFVFYWFFGKRNK